MEPFIPFPMIFQLNISLEMLGFTERTGEDIPSEIRKRERVGKGKKETHSSFLNSITRTFDTRRHPPARYDALPCARSLE